MDDNRLKFGVGVLVIAAIGIGIILTFLFGAVPQVLTGEYKLNVAFPSAEGIGSNTKVLFRGIEVGRVIKEELRDEDVLLTLGIESQYRKFITHEYLPKIGNGSVITGDSKLEFVKASEQELVSILRDQPPQIRTQPYNDEDYLSYGKKASDPFSLMFELEDELRATLGAIRTASGSLETVGANVNQLVGDAKGVVGTADKELSTFAKDARGAVVEFQGAMRDVRELIGNDELKESLADTFSALPQVLSEAQATFQSTQKTFESFEKVGERFEQVGVAAERAVTNVDLTVDEVRQTVKAVQPTFESAEQAIANVERITQPLADNSDELVADVMTGLKSLDRTLRQVETFTTALNNADGTVRRLLEDDELYWQVRRTVENIELASARLRPILDDARIFSDKIARDPRELGIRGALGKRPSGMGLK